MGSHGHTTTSSGGIPGTRDGLAVSCGAAGRRSCPRSGLHRRRESWVLSDSLRGRPRSQLWQNRTLLGVGLVGRVGEPRGDCAETEMAQGSTQPGSGPTQSRLSARTVALATHPAPRDSACNQASGPHPPIERAFRSAQRMMREDVIGLTRRLGLCSLATSRQDVIV